MYSHCTHSQLRHTNVLSFSRHEMSVAELVDVDASYVMSIGFLDVGHGIYGVLGLFYRLTASTFGS